MGKIFWVVIIFLVIGSVMIVNSLDTDFDDSEDRTGFVKEFFRWMGTIGKSTTNTAGYAIKQDWLPDVNESNSS